MFSAKDAAMLARRQYPCTRLGCDAWHRLIQQSRKRKNYRI